jgi:carboxymethylenebutenolidase
MEKQMPYSTESNNISRREVLGAGAAALALSTLKLETASAQPDGQAGNSAPKAEAPKTKLLEREVVFKSGDAQIKAFRAQPEQTPKAAIIVIHEIFGLNAHIRDVARRFARQGYVCLAPDLYTREGAPNLDINNRAALMAFIASISDRRVVADLQAGLEYLGAEGIEKIGSIGFCMGGLYSYLLACKSDKLDAAADFYGRIVYAETSENKPESPLELAPGLKCPLLCCFGETDASIPQSDVAKLRDALKASTQSWKINVYPGAGHAFFNDTRPSYNAGAAGDAGNETLAFFRRYLKKDEV